MIIPGKSAIFYMHKAHADPARGISTDITDRLNLVEFNKQLLRVDQKINNLENAIKNVATLSGHDDELNEYLGQLGLFKKVFKGLKKVVKAPFKLTGKVLGIGHKKKLNNLEQGVDTLQVKLANRERPSIIAPKSTLVPTRQNVPIPQFIQGPSASGGAVTSGFLSPRGDTGNNIKTVLIKWGIPLAAMAGLGILFAMKKGNKYVSPRI